MEKEKSVSRFEYSGHNEDQINRRINLLKNNNLQGSIFFSQKIIKKKKSFRWIRIRSFFTKHKTFKRLMEFSIHPTGVHMLRLAIFHSDNGCQMCRVYVEKNLFWLLV